jgi:hypothetical protein
MATNYPGAVDSFVNPTATDTLDSATVPHAAQHDNINDAMSAVQVTLGVNPQGSSATVVARLTALDSTVAGKAATNQTMYVGTTALAINRSSASQTLTGVSIDGNAATVTNGVYTSTTSLPNVTSVNSTTIPASATLLTSGSSLDPTKLSAGTAGISISGNAATATALQTARTINSVSFDGTANITVADATKLPLTGGTLTGQLAAKSTSTSTPSVIVSPQGAISLTVTAAGTGGGFTVTYTLSSGTTTGLYVGQLISVTGISGGTGFNISNVAIISITSSTTFLVTNSWTGSPTGPGTLTTTGVQANLQEWQTSGGTVKASVDTAGNITGSGLKVSGATSGTATIVAPAVASTPTLTTPTTSGTLLTDASSLTATKINAGVLTITASTDLSADTTTYAVIVNNASSVTITLPTAANNNGRIMKFLHTTTTGVTSASSNVISPTGTTSSSILSSGSIAGKFSEIICNGTNWQRVFEN